MAAAPENESRRCGRGRKSIQLFENDLVALFAEKIELEAGRDRLQRAWSETSRKQEMEMVAAQSKNFIRDSQDTVECPLFIPKFDHSCQMNENDTTQSSTVAIVTATIAVAVEPPVTREEKHRKDVESKEMRREDEFRREGTKRHLLARYKEAKENQRVADKEERAEVTREFGRGAKVAGEEAREVKRQLVQAEDELADEWEYEEMRKKFDKLERREKERRVKGKLREESIQNQRELTQKFRKAEPCWILRSLRPKNNSN